MWIECRRRPTVTKEVEKFEENPSGIVRRQARRSYGDSRVTEDHKQDPGPTVML